MEETGSVGVVIEELRFEVVCADLAEKIDLAVVLDRAENGPEGRNSGPEADPVPAGRFVEHLRTSKVLQKPAPRTLEQHALEAMEDF